MRPSPYSVRMTNPEEDEGYTFAERLERIDILLQMLIAATLMDSLNPKSRSKIYADDETANLVDDAYAKAMFFAENWRASHDAGGEL